MLYGDGNESEEFFNFYSGVIQEIASTVKFNETYSYSDYQQDDYVSANTLTNLIDRSYGRGITTDPTSHIAFCLITTSDLKVSKITEADYPRFAGKVINFFVSEIKQEIADISEDGEVNVLSGMYGPGDRQTFKKTEVYTNAYSAAYTNIIELNGDKEGDKVKYEYKNKLQFENGKPVRLYAYIDQTGFSISKWTLKLNCRDYDYTAEEKLVAKKFTPNSNSLKRTTTGTPPPYFFELAEKIKKLESQGIDGTIKKGKNNYGKVKIGKGFESYSLLVEEDETDFMIIYRYPEGTSKMEGSLIYNSDYEYTEFFEKVYKNGPSENISTSIQPNLFGIDGELEDYLSPEYIIDDFNFTYITRMGDYILNFETTIGMERISSYIENKESFSIASYLKNEAWHASTFKILSTIDDFKNLAKNNPNTLCNILWEPLIKDLNIKELNEGNLEEELNNSGITKSSLGCK